MITASSSMKMLNSFRLTQYLKLYHGYPPVQLYSRLLLMNQLDDDYSHKSLDTDKAWLHSEALAKN
jgi:hypothetical protein